MDQFMEEGNSLVNHCTRIGITTCQPVGTAGNEILRIPQASSFQQTGMSCLSIVDGSPPRVGELVRVAFNPQVCAPHAKGGEVVIIRLCAGGWYWPSPFQEQTQASQTNMGRMIDWQLE